VSLESSGICIVDDKGEVIEDFFRLTRFFREKKKARSLSLERRCLAAAL
jgi:hypothetical protein